MSDPLVMQWLDHARADLRVAAEILQPDWDYIAVALFLAQQAAEKTIKGLLHFRGIDPPKTHDLSVLATLVSDPQLQAELDEIAQYSDYAVLFRYPGDFDEPDMTETTYILSVVRGFFKNVLNSIPPELRPNGHEKI